MFLRVFLWTGEVLEVWNTLQKLDQFPESKIVVTQIQPTYRRERWHSGGPLLSDTSKPQAGCSTADRKNQNWPKSSGRISFLDLQHMKTTQQPGSSSKWWNYFILIAETHPAYGRKDRLWNHQDPRRLSAVQPDGLDRPREEQRNNKNQCWPGLV